MLTLVVPVYRNEASIDDLLARVEELRETVPDSLEAVFVVDGSPDRSHELLRQALPGRHFPSRLVSLARNYGAFAAIRAGLELGRGDRMAVMAADLQEPAELILAMDKRLRTGPIDLVVAVREARHDPLMQRLPATIFWALYRRFVMPEVPAGGVDVFACTRSYRDRLLQLEEHGASLIAQLFFLGGRRATVSYVRLPRKHGRSAWTFRRKLDYMGDSIQPFTDIPLRWMRWGGAIFATLSAGLGLFLALGGLAGWLLFPPAVGLGVLIAFFGGLNLLGLGLVGDYAWRSYQNSRRGPLHTVVECLDFGEPPESSTS